MEREAHASQIQRLLEAGQRHFERGETDSAVAVWSEVLQLEPDEPRALEYLRSAGTTDEERLHEHIRPHGTGPLRAHLELLLAERRYEEALDFLHTARWQTPDAPEISRGIHLLKERLLRRYLHKIGNLDSVPRVSSIDDDIDTLTDEERTLLRLVDGISSFGDIAHESRLGRFETYRALARFLDIRIVISSPPAVAATPPLVDTDPAGFSRPSTVPARPRRPWIVAAEILLAAGILGGAGWFLWRRSGEGIAAQARARAAAAEPSPAAPAPSEPLPAAPPPSEPAPVAPAAATEAEAVLDLSVDAGPADDPIIEIQPEPERDPETVERIAEPAREPRAAIRAPAPPAPLRGRAAVTRPPGRAPTPVAGPARAPAPEPAVDSTPAKPEPEPEPAAVAAPAVTEPPAAPDKPAAPAPRPAAPAAPLSFDAQATVSDLAVIGPLARGVVERAVDRAVPSFRACYTSAASAAGKNAAATMRVVITIDETGRAQEVSAMNGTLPALDACMQEAARHIRTQVAPDVGTVRVAFSVAFAPRGR